MAALHAAKNELRALMRQRLAQLSTESLAQQSEIVRDCLLCLPEYKRAVHLGIYMSMPRGEISTNAIVEDAFQQRKQIFVPYIYKGQSQDQSHSRSVMDMVTLHSKEDHEGLEKDAWGIPTPSADSVDERDRILDDLGDKGSDAPERASRSNDKHAQIDVILMPGVAFDGCLGRLGHGKGFYDYFLEQYHDSKAAPMPFLVGLALDVQLLPDHQTIPIDASDWKLDALVIGDGTVIRKATGG